MECHSDLILNSLATYSFPLDWLPAPPPPCYTLLFLGSLCLPNLQNTAAGS